MVKILSLILSLISCAAIPTVAGSNVDNVNREKPLAVTSSTDNINKVKLLAADEPAKNTVTMYDDGRLVYSDSSYVWDYCFEQMTNKQKELSKLPGPHAFKCVIDMQKDEVVDRFSWANHFPMSVTINMNGNKITLNYGDYWNVDYGLTINGGGGTFTTTRGKSEYNCSIFVNGGNLSVYDTNFENFVTNMRYPLFATGNNVTKCDFRRCNFKNCGSTAYGGAICMEEVTESLFYECTFDNCFSKYGGAIYLEDIFASTLVEPISVRSCNFNSCTASHSGGAMYIYHNKDTEHTLVASYHRTQFKNCTATYYGGAIYGDAYHLTINFSDTNIDHCEAGYYGGGIYTDNYTASVDGGEICFCKAQYGGGVYFNGTYPILYSVTIHDCQATKSGGAYYAKYGTELEHIDGGISITNCNFYNNTPSDGKATAMSSGSLVILFGVLSGVFLASTGVFAYLYLRKRKQVSGK